MQNLFRAGGLFLAVLLFHTVSLAQRNAWTQLGKSGDWQNTVDMVAMNGSLYSIESDGTLWRTDQNGNYEQLAEKGSFTDLILMVGLDGYLFTLEGNGTLYRTNTRTLRWEKLGADWKNTVAMTALNGFLYSIETD
ncbi:MAG: hypothetical protein KKG00_14750, partial [Bacteroidetes bacterium]|nr:hypothetical protein [Bacteroidota bacterium]